jgi:hypothetical protein
MPSGIVADGRRLRRTYEYINKDWLPMSFFLTLFCDK